MPSIDYEVTGADEALIRIKAIPNDVERQIRDIVDEASEVAFAEMEMRVPQSVLSGSIERPDHRTIKESLAIETITFAPGGLGGGGFYEVQVGALDNPPSHFEAVVGGSSNFPRSTGERNNFQLMGFPGNFFMHREGQDPQREWIDDAIDLARTHVATRIQTIHIG